MCRGPLLFCLVRCRLLRHHDANLAALLGKERFALPEEEEAPPAPAAEGKFDPKAVIEKYVEGEEETGFNLDDVLNPKGKLDLEKLCRSLGLMEEEE